MMTACEVVPMILSEGDNGIAAKHHIGSNPNGQQKKWYDNVVAATSYIGPLKK